MRFGRDHGADIVAPTSATIRIWPNLRRIRLARHIIRVRADFNPAPLRVPTRPHCKRDIFPHDGLNMTGLLEQAGAPGGDSGFILNVMQLQAGAS